MKQLNRWLSLCALLLSLLVPAMAQETTGSIEGTVTDAQGARIPGASVQVTGPAFNRTVTADGTGVYRMLQVPPGIYSITITASNFSPVKKENVKVTLGTATIADLTLQAGNVSDVVQITESDVAQIDTTGNKVQTSLSERQIEMVPKGTNFASVLNVSTATRPEPLNAGFQIDGSSGAENTFIIDGLEVTNFRTGQLRNAADLPFEFVKEVQIKTSGFEAEFGGATGGVVNVVSKGGGNEFHGSAGVQIENDRFFGATRPIMRTNSTTLQYVTPGSGNNSLLNPPDDQFTNLFPSFSLGGPVVKDRAWFFASYAPQFFDIERRRIYQDGTSQLFNTKVRREYILGRIDANVTNNLRVTSSWVYNPERQHGQLDGGFNDMGIFKPLGLSDNATPFDSPTSPGDFSQRGGRVAAQNFTYGVTWTPSSNWVIGVRGGRNYLNEKDDSYGVPNTLRIRCLNAGNTGLPGVTTAGTCASGFANIGSNFATQKDISIRHTLDADASVVVNQFAGRHLFKFGYQFNRISNDVDQGYFNIGEVRLFFGQTGSAGGLALGTGANDVGYGYLQRFGTVGLAESNNQAVYFQDSWQPINRLTVNLGLRLERENVPTFSSTGQEIVFDWGSKPAPRLGFAYDLFGDGRTKIFASYGWFYDRFKYELPRGSFGGDKFTREYFNITSANPNWDYYTVSNINSISLVTLDFRVPSNDPSDNRIDPDLKAARQSEFTVGVEHELQRNLVLAARYTHKQLDRTIEDVGFFDNIGNENFFIANPGLGIVSQPFASGIPATPKAQREYDAFEIRMDKRFSQNYYANASYTYSRLFGNYSGLASSDENGRSSPNVNRFFDLPFLGFNTNGQPDNGRLATDRPHVFKAFAGYTLNWLGSQANSTDFTLGYFAQSGTPLSTRIQFFGANTFLYGRGDLGRTPAFTQTDFAVRHKIKIGEGKDVGLEMNVINLFNQDTAVRYFSVISPANLSGAGFTGCGTCSEIDTIRAMFSTGLQSQIVSRLASGSIATDARFNQPDRFQGPRQIRFGLRFTF